MSSRCVILCALLALVVCLVAVPLLAQQPDGYLKAKVDPGRAGVFIDGKYVGPAANFGVSRKYAVAPGKHEVKLADPRYEEAVIEVEIQPGKTARISQSLKRLAPAQPPFGTLRIIGADKFAPVYVNGRYHGHADEFSNSSQGLLLPPGQYEVRVDAMSGASLVKESLSITANETTTLRASK